ncbi:hypothetical protein BRD00_10325 [Halobacteriales archaeon QS_8_69_26]|nr:MAG: hypothetical protein BRD00_10325 [Halobacteriales archaeon QS_8_69_26]
MYYGRNPIAGFIAVITIGVFDLAYAAVTPCSLALPPDSGGSTYVLWVHDGCSFGMQTGSLLVTAAAGLLGFGLGWLIVPGSMRRY